MLTEWIERNRHLLNAQWQRELAAIADAQRAAQAGQGSAMNDAIDALGAQHGLCRSAGGVVSVAGGVLYGYVEGLNDA